MQSELDGKRKRKPNVVKKLKSIFDKIQPTSDKILVIQPGSHYIRMGTADQLVCQTYYHCIAHAGNKSDGCAHYYPDDEIEYSQQEILQFVKTHKVRPIPNSKLNASNFNAASEKVELEDYNDAFLIQFIEPTKDKKNSFYVGEEARRIASLVYDYDNSVPYKLYHPIQNGLLNLKDYFSMEQLKLDLFRIWSFHCKKLISNFKDYSVMLIVDDLLDRKTMSLYASVLMDLMEFNGIQILQSSVCCGLATGWNTCTVVDIGAQKTSISCVENGLSLPYSRIYLPVGGDDITVFMKVLLSKINFPDLDLNKPWHYDILEDMKKNFCSFDPLDYKVVQGHVFIRDYKQKTIKYDFKMMDEYAVAPFMLFNDHLFDILEKLNDLKPNIALYSNDPELSITVDRIKHLWNRVFINKLEDEKIGRKEQYRSRSRAPNLITGLVCLDHFKQDLGKEVYKEEAESEDESSSQPENNEMETTPQTDFVFTEEELVNFFSAPLDTAIYLSMMRASVGQLDKISKFSSNILLTGGGSKLKHLGPYLMDKMSEKKILVKKAPRELDSESLAWQGAAETAKIIDTWITKPEWDVKREFAINDKAYFVW